MKRKVYCSDPGYFNWIDNTKSNNEIDGSDLIIFTGGPDVSPTTYGEKRCKYTSASPTRDSVDQERYKDALQCEIPMVGICRGAQFLTVMAGGKLIQDVAGHVMGLPGHSIKIADKYDDTGDVDFAITSTHHQMLNPFVLPDEEYDLIGYCSPGRSSHYMEEGNILVDPWVEYDKRFVESEIIYYPKINALAIQGHPERMDKDSPVVLLLNTLINKLLFEL